MSANSYDRFREWGEALDAEAPRSLGESLLAYADAWAKDRAEIERLRSRVADLECSEGCVPMATLDAAQAEIERLRDKQVTATYDAEYALAQAHGVAQACERRAEKAEAEIERLRTLNMTYEADRQRAIDDAERLATAGRWASERLTSETHHYTCGVLGQPMCPLHAALAAHSVPRETQNEGS